MTRSGRTLRPALPGVSASAGESGVCTPDTPGGRHGVWPEHQIEGHCVDRVTSCQCYEGNCQQRKLLTRTSKINPPSTHLGQDKERRGRGGCTSIHGSRPRVGETQRRPEMKGSRRHGKIPGRRGGPAATWGGGGAVWGWRESGVNGE